MKHTNIWLAASATLLVLSIGACHGSGESNQGKALVSTESPAQAHDSVLTQQNAVLQSQKDSLFGETRSLLEAMASIDSAATLAGAKAPKHHGEPIPSYEEGVRARTVAALQRLRAVQARLRTSVAAVEKLSGQNQQTNADLASFRETAAALQTQVTTEQARVDSLMQQLAMVQAHVDTLTGKNKQLSTTIDSMVTESRKAYLVSGTKSYLLTHGIVQEVGGTRFPFIVKVGTTLRPANVHPDTTLFQSFDMFTELVIPLDSTKEYEVVSVQDLAGANQSNAKGRIFRGSIHITDPQRFWMPSPYLILRER